MSKFDKGMVAIAAAATIGFGGLAGYAAVNVLDDSGVQPTPSQTSVVVVPRETSAPRSDDEASAQKSVTASPTQATGSATPKKAPESPSKAPTAKRTLSRKEKEELARQVAWEALNDTFKGQPKKVTDESKTKTRKPTPKVTTGDCEAGNKSECGDSDSLKNYTPRPGEWGYDGAE